MSFFGTFVKSNFFERVKIVNLFQIFEPRNLSEWGGGTSVFSEKHGQEGKIEFFNKSIFNYYLSHLT